MKTPLWLIATFLSLVVTVSADRTSLQNEPFFTGVSIGCSEVPKENATFGDPFCLDERANIQRRASHHLEWFFTRLKSFIDGYRFDSRGLEIQGRSLGREMHDITELLALVGPLEQDLSEKLVYTNYLFHVMGNSIEILKHYESMSAPGHGLVWTVIDLHVRVLALRTSRGHPDISAPNYAEKVTSGVRDLMFLREGFDTYADVPFGMYMAFEYHHAHAERMLKELVQHIPKGW